jgi:uncharacterized protein
MHIAFDLTHPAHANFFKNAAERLRAEGARVSITALRRGALPRIVSAEFGDYSPTFIGRHRETPLSVIVEANLLRFPALLAHYARTDVDVAVSVSGFVLGSAMRILGVPNLQFYDDPERTKNVLLSRLTATEYFLPACGSPSGKISTFDALKEWSYLSPSYFRPQVDALKRYGLQRGKYIFVREVSTGSLNYSKQLPFTVASVASSIEIPSDWRVVLSLEDKSGRSLFPDDWVLMEEPVDDIHSLIYFSRAVISSGDSMAREGAVLGVPAVYCGHRQMVANEVMAREGMLFHVPPDGVMSVVSRVIQEPISRAGQEVFREILRDRWEDVTSRILTEIRKAAKDIE